MNHMIHVGNGLAIWQQVEIQRLHLKTVDRALAFASAQLPDLVWDINTPIWGFPNHLNPLPAEAIELCPNEDIPDNVDLILVGEEFGKVKELE